MNTLAAFMVAASEADTDAERQCCSFAKRMDEIAYGKTVVDRAPNALWNLHIDSKNPWGPVDAARLTTATGIELASMYPGAYRVQGWRKMVPPDLANIPVGVTGHTFTIVIAPGPPKLAVVLDCANRDRAGNVRGPKMQLVELASYLSQYVSIASCRLKEL